VDHVDVIGSYVPEVRINFDYEKLKKYKLSINQLV
jgi:multidrug efflux pump subunit AcrB